MQDKIDCNNINEIREERNAKSIYTGSTTSRAYIQSWSNPLEIFHYLCKSFIDFEHTLGSLTLVLKDSPRDNPSLDYNCHNPRDNQSLDYNWLFEMNRKISLLYSGWYKLEFLEEFLSFRDDNTIWSLWMNSQ